MRCIYKSLLIAFLPFALNSCYYNYGKTIPVTPMFKAKNEYLLNIYPSYNSLQGQFGFSVTNNLGFISTVRLSNVSALDAGVLFFQPLFKNKNDTSRMNLPYLDFCAGAGIGSGGGSSPAFGFLNPESKDVYGRYNKYFFGLSLYSLLKTPKNRYSRITLGNRFNFLVYDELSVSKTLAVDSDDTKTFTYKSKGESTIVSDTYLSYEFPLSKLFSMNIGFCYSMNLYNNNTKRYVNISSVGAYSSYIDDEYFTEHRSIIYYPVTLLYGLNFRF